MHEVFKLQSHCSKFAVQVPAQCSSSFVFISPLLPLLLLLLRPLSLSVLLAPVCFAPLSQPRPRSPPSSFSRPSHRYLSLYLQRRSPSSASAIERARLVSCVSLSDSPRKQLFSVLPTVSVVGTSSVHHHRTTASSLLRHTATPLWLLQTRYGHCGTLTTATSSSDTRTADLYGVR
jgi:hypothetical protein